VGDKSNIEWTESTWNPVTGCTKVSQGCRNCYALRDWPRLSANPQTVYFGRAFTDVQCHDDRLGQPLEWKKPRRIFVNSMSDLFHAAVPDGFIAGVFSTMMLADQHTYQILTKRPERMRAFLHSREWAPPAHIQIGVSCEDQMTWEERVPELLAIPAAVKFVSLEPLLGQIDARGRTSKDQQISIPPASDWPLAGLQWVIVGGESGPAARPMSPAWARWLRDQCEIARVPFFFKQWGEWVAPDQMPESERGTVVRARECRVDGLQLLRAGKKRAGRMLDGRTHDGYPAVEA
jgi:protein gp37